MRRRTSLIVSLVFLVLAASLLWQRQAVYDWLRLRGYEPTAEIAALADNTTMLPGAERIFYVQHPKLEGKETFNQHCSQAEQTIVLGCYIATQGIFLYDITDKRLEGIEEVTAAHEMLHAAYDRLSGRERARVNTLLETAFNNIQSKRIRKTIDNYRKNGADVSNELHSILGTEVRKLPSELEAYYSRYFADRSRIVDYSEQYEAVFIEQQEKIEDLARRIDAFEHASQSERTAIEAELASLQTEAQRMDGLRSSGQVAAYNAAVSVYNARASALNARVNTYNASLATYRSLIDQYNQLAQTQRELNAAIDSRLSTQTSR